MRRPNILWITFEDTSPRFGCYGDPLARTPNVDRLAAEGCRYANTFAVASMCSPARSAIITGMYPTFIGAHHHRSISTDPVVPGLPTPYECVPPHHVRLIPEYLRAAGYYCTNNVKTDYQFEPPLSAWDHVSTEAHWRNRPDPGQPFFAVFNGEVTHESGMWDEKFPGGTKTDPARVVVPPYLPDTPRVRGVIARQYDNVAMNDGWAGSLLRQLEEDGLADNTIVFLWSDHGEGLPRAKCLLYDSGIRVPMIVRWPGGLEPGSVDDRLVSTIDLGPTVLALAGVQSPVHLQGQPFLGPRARRRGHIFAAGDRQDQSYDMVRIVRDKRFKYFRNYYAGTPPLAIWHPYRDHHPAMRELWRLHAAGQLTGPQQFWFTPRPAEELYDTREDPYEIHNLAEDPDHASIREQLRAVMDNCLQRYDRFGAVDERTMVHQWWSGEEQPTTAPVRALAYRRDGTSEVLREDDHTGVDYGQYAAADGVSPVPLGGNQTLGVPVLLRFVCATQGASIAWSTEPDAKPPRWRLYTGPIRLTEPAALTIHVIAHRIGYKPARTTCLRLSLARP